MELPTARHGVERRHDRGCRSHLAAVRHAKLIFVVNRHRVPDVSSNSLIARDSKLEFPRAAEC